MAAPTRTEILELDISWLGRPFARVEAKELLTAELDVSWLGQPFVGSQAAAGPPGPSYNPTQMLMVF